MIETPLPRARKQGLVVQEIEDELVLYDAVNDKAHVLNRTAALVWQYADGKREPSEIARLVRRETNMEADARVVRFALAQLQKSGLLEGGSGRTNPWGSLTRREFLRTATTAALVIPVVKSIHAPYGSSVGSCLPISAACSTNAECCTLFCDAGFCGVTDCFVPGTPVWYADGTRRPIEQARVGELILSRDELSGVVAPQAVEKLYVWTVQASFTLHMENRDAIGTTAPHPFYTDAGWTRAGDLRAGAHCRLGDGSRAQVSEIVHSEPHTQKVYNLRVGGYHTYFVGASGVWVHNKD